MYFLSPVTSYFILFPKTLHVLMINSISSIKVVQLAKGPKKKILVTSVIV